MSFSVHGFVPFSRRLLLDVAATPANRGSGISPMTSLWIKNLVLAVVAWFVTFVTFIAVDFGIPVTPLWLSHVLDVAAGLLVRRSIIIGLPPVRSGILYDDFGGTRWRGIRVGRLRLLLLLNQGSGSDP
jgi:hypothetical protein